MKKWTVAFLAIAMMSFIATASMAKEGGKPDKKDRPCGFVRAALERDGFVDLRAVPKDTPNHVLHFLKKADSDKNGQVTKKEMREFAKKMHDAKKGDCIKQGKTGKDCPKKGDFPGKCAKCPCAEKCSCAKGGKCICGDKCKCPKYPGKFGPSPFGPKGPQFGRPCPAPFGAGPAPMFAVERMKETYKEGFKDGFKAAMELMKEGHRGPRPDMKGPKFDGKPCPKMDGKCPFDGKGPKFDGKGPRPDWKDGKFNRPKFEDPFKKYGDGNVIVLDKLPKDVWPQFAENLKAADGDKDGKVCRKEFGDFMKAKWEKMKADRKTEGKKPAERR